VLVHDGKPKVLRKQGERYESYHLLKTVKYGGGSLMVWSCFWANGYGPLVFVDGNTNQDLYVDRFSQQFLPWYYKLPHLKDGEYIFQEDNAPCHTDGYAKWWKSSHSLNVLKDWPARSPDLNPIEHIWSELARQLRSRRPDIKNTKDLRQTLDS
jgi:hypothetical protein